MNKQNGQVFPLTALMLVVLIGAAALAIDVSMAFNQQRRQQQDLDTVTKLASTGYTYSQAQGFLNARGYDVSSTSGFTLTTPPLSGPYAGKSGYVEGNLTQNLRSFFGKVLSFGQFKVSVHAVAQKGGYSHRKYTIMALSNTGYSNSGNSVNCNGGATVVITGDVASNTGICDSSNGLTVNGNSYPNAGVSDPYSNII